MQDPVIFRLRIYISIAISAIFLILFRVGGDEPMRWGVAIVFCCLLFPLAYWTSKHILELIADFILLEVNYFSISKSLFLFIQFLIYAVCVAIFALTNRNTDAFWYVMFCVCMIFASYVIADLLADLIDVIINWRHYWSEVFLPFLFGTLLTTMVFAVSSVGLALFIDRLPNSGFCILGACGLIVVSRFVALALMDILDLIGSWLYRE